MFNQIRNFVHTMKNPISRKIFFLYKFAPKRYSEFRDLMYTLNTQLHQGTITEVEMDSALLSF
jgi:rRNA pseudouridine-1189 N-methylase Emg1 (Nep1/Mra1 family)